MDKWTEQQWNTRGIYFWHCKIIFFILLVCMIGVQGYQTSNVQMNLLFFYIRILISLGGSKICINSQDRLFKVKLVEGFSWNHATIDHWEPLSDKWGILPLFTPWPENMFWECSHQKIENMYFLLLNQIYRWNGTKYLIQITHDVWNDIFFKWLRCFK